MRANWFLSLGLLLALAAGSYALFVYLQPEQLPDGIIYGNGRVEAIEVRIASEVAGRVVESAVVEGRAFRKGDLLVRIDDTDLKIQLGEAQANRLALVQSREKTMAVVHVGQHHTMTAESNARRYRTLAGTSDVSKQQVESIENTLSEAQGLLAGGQASVAQIDAQIAGADNAIALIQDQMVKCRVTAPSDGTILVKSVEPGEVVAAGQPLAVMADLAHLELKIYVPEYDLGRLKLGGGARVATDAFPNHFAPASIKRIDQEAQFTPRDIHMPDERARTVFGVTLGVLNPHGELKPGMPVDAWVKWRDDVAWPARVVVPE
jgi:HlyD family secretion protein